MDRYTLPEKPGEVVSATWLWRPRRNKYHRSKVKDIIMNISIIGYGEIISIFSFKILLLGPWELLKIKFVWVHSWEKVPVSFCEQIRSRSSCASQSDQVLHCSHITYISLSGPTQFRNATLYISHSLAHFLHILVFLICQYKIYVLLERMCGIFFRRTIHIIVLFSDSEINKYQETFSFPTMYLYTVLHRSINTPSSQCKLNCHMYVKYITR